MKTEWCYCGRLLNVFGLCPRHKDKITKEPKQKIGKYSGKSKTPYGKYEER
jgi:hypothetical protein